jgi:hypothetical protein
MPFQKGQGGRPRGALNKRKILQVEDVLFSVGADPTSQLLKLIKDGNLGDRDKARIWIELLSYCQSKPRDFGLDITLEVPRLEVIEEDTGTRTVVELAPPQDATEPL